MSGIVQCKLTLTDLRFQRAAVHPIASIFKSCSTSLFEELSVSWHFSEQAED